MRLLAINARYKIFNFLFIKANCKDRWSTKAEQKNLKLKIKINIKCRLNNVFTILLINSILKYQLTIDVKKI